MPSPISDATSPLLLLWHWLECYALSGWRWLWHLLRQVWQSSYISFLDWILLNFMLISGTTQACGQMLDWLEGAQPVEPGRGWGARRGSVGAGGRPSATAGWPGFLSCLGVFASNYSYSVPAILAKTETVCYCMTCSACWPESSCYVTLLQISPQSQVVLYNCTQVQLL